MQEDINVRLNETGQWLLYRAMVCESLDRNPHAKALIDCDPWEFSGALDMSFEETRKLPLEHWHEAISADMQQMIDMA